MAGDRSNIHQIVYMHISIGDWGVQPQVQVLSSNYGGQLIQSGRLHYSTDGQDPWFSLDLLINNLVNADDTFIITYQSWGQARFLTTPNWGPWPFSFTGSNDITKDYTQLIFPMAVGNYTSNAWLTSGIPLNYYLQGMPVVIEPRSNYITQSALSNPAMYSPHALQVNGNINTSSSYYCNNSKGMTTNVYYGGYNLYFSGGILVSKTPP
jgi:hypothetical protein